MSETNGTTSGQETSGRGVIVVLLICIFAATAGVMLTPPPAGAASVRVPPCTEQLSAVHAAESGQGTLAQQSRRLREVGLFDLARAARSIRGPEDAVQYGIELESTGSYLRNGLAAVAGDCAGRPPLTSAERATLRVIALLEYARGSNQLTTARAASAAAGWMRIGFGGNPEHGQCAYVWSVGRDAGKHGTSVEECEDGYGDNS